MKKLVTLSVVTPTRNRPVLLEKHLLSLVGQLTPRDEVLIIDNSSNKRSQEVVLRFQQRLPICYFQIKTSVYANLYNFAIARCTKELTVFLDDDCIANPGFTKALRKAHQEAPTLVIQGKTLSLPRKNIYAETSGDHLRSWLQKNSIGHNLLRTVDNKNLAISTKLIKKLGGFSPKMTAGAEDTELGYRLYKLGVPVVYSPSVLAYHYERITLKDFLQQHFRVAKSHAILDTIFEDQDRIGMINRYTWRSHFKNMIYKMSRYWRERRCKDLILLPLVYGLLLIVRSSGYITGLINSKARQH